MKRRRQARWMRLVTFVQAWWPDVFIAACDPVNPALLVLAIRATRRIRWGSDQPAYGRPSYDGGPMRSSSLTVTI